MLTGNRHDNDTLPGLQLIDKSSQADPIRSIVGTTLAVVLTSNRHDNDTLPGLQLIDKSSQADPIRSIVGTTLAVVLNPCGRLTSVPCAPVQDRSLRPGRDAAAGRQKACGYARAPAQFRRQSV